MAAAMGALIKLGMDPTLTASTEQYEVTLTGLNVNEALHDQNGFRGSRSHASERVRQGTRAPSFTVVLEPNSVELDLLLPRILGGTEAADVFPVAETLPSFVVNMDLVQQRWHWTGCKVSRATFRSASGQPLELTLEVEAQDVATSATAFPALSISTVGPYMFHDASAGISVGGTLYQFRTFELLVDNVLDTGRFLMTQTRNSIETTDRIVQWTLDGPYGDNSALYGLAVSGVACVATFTLGARSLAFSSNKVAFPRESPTVNAKEEIFLPLVGIARMDGSTREIVVTNDSTP